MRVSIDVNDPGFVVDPTSYRVTLDGAPVAAVTADEETGECWVWDDEARARGLLATKLLRGRVRVERWEQGCVDHPEGTVGFLDETDGFWVWCHPDHDGYRQASARATHFWDPHTKAWISPAHRERIH